MLADIIFGVIIITALAAVVILLFFMRKPYTWKREIKGEKTVFRFEARRDIKGVMLVGKFGKENIRFERKNIKRGEAIEFAYPASTEPATLIVETEDGKKEYEV
ncbi:MAG: hypothetical protein QW590_02725 [Candidatus Bilamarchaeaceae archaeon]